MELVMFGGGTVLLGPGCLLFTLVLNYGRAPALAEIRSSYCHILGHIAHALEGLLPGIAPRGVSDLAASDRKFSGNAQQIQQVVGQFFERMRHTENGDVVCR